MPSIFQLSAEAHAGGWSLIFPPIVFGVIAFVAFFALAAVTWGFRNVANRHAPKAEAYAREHGAKNEQ